MYRKTVNYLRGEVTARCRSAAPERVLNLCSAHEVPFWGLSWEDAYTFCFHTTADGLRTLRAVTEEGAVEWEELEHRGAPVMLRRVRRRYVLLTAVVLALLWLWVGSSVILFFSVSGNETVSDQEILRALERHGVAFGTRALSVDQEALRNRVLLELHDLSWLTVNVRGCTAHVQVVERQRPPRRYDPYVAANVVAEKSGLITEVRALNGKSCVAVGDTVTRGQLLLSGVSDGRFGGVRFLHATGEIWGRTWYTFTARVPLTVQVQGEIQRERTRYSLLVGNKRINFFPRGSILGAGCDKITVTYPVKLPFGGELPLSLCREQTVQHEWQQICRSEEAALSEGKLWLLQQLTAQLGEGGTVTDTRFTHRLEGELLLVTLVAECREQLGMEVPVAYGE
ncbi:MAG: sporulation protein YqfD [Oscillospiraceae bacterium]|nr:sporulation protein YqfD [Oscillospiraceae bacterium]